MPRPHALIATVSFHGTVVEQRTLPRAHPSEIGADGTLAVPLPAGAEYLARCVWKGPERVEVVDALERTQEVVPGQDASVVLGPVRVDVSLVPQFPLRRAFAFDTVLSIAWAAIVLMATLTFDASMLAYDKRCEWFGVGCEPVGGDMGGVDVTAEYLARLLRDDLAGEDVGRIANEVDRPEAERKTKDIFLPAGNTGPIDKMGGAEESAPERNRSPEEKEAVPDIPEGGKPKPLYVEDPEAELQHHLEPDEASTDGVVDVTPIDPEDEQAPPTEEERGWGIRDWYDEQDARIDNLEIELMIEMARRTLRIDPDDAAALSILSYYQYLAQDYDAALRTYDRYIRLYPDQAAGYNNKALVYKRLGEYAEEERLYRVALALEPGDVTAMNNLAVNLSHQGRHDEAVALMARLEELDPDDPYADLHRAKVFAQMGQDELALHFLDKALIGMAKLDTLHHIEFRQDIRVDPSFAKLRETRAFRDILVKYYGADSPLQGG